jgi:hypothetical protein
LLATRNKGHPSTKEEAKKKKEHKVFLMVWLSELNNPQDDTAGISEEVHTKLIDIDTGASIFLDALVVQETLRV